MRRKAKTKVAKVRKTLAAKLAEATRAGWEEGHRAGCRQTRAEYGPDAGPAVAKFVSNVDNLKDLDEAVVQIFVTNLHTHAQLLMPLTVLRAVAGELKRLGY